MLAGLLAAVGSAVLFGVAAVHQATAARRLEGRSRRLTGFVVVGVRDRVVLGVVGAYLAGFVLHAVAIWLLPLYLAQATVALSFPVTALVAAHRLDEALAPRRWVGVAAVVGGLVLLALAAGAPGPAAASWSVTGLAWLALLGCLGLGALALRTRRPLLVGALSGCGYAGSAIAVRGVAADTSWAVATAAVAVPLLGLVAFWLYSLSLAMGHVVAATGALIVTQTFLPALAGVAALGDGVRAGWAPAIGVGLLLAVGGALVVGSVTGEPDSGQPATS